MPRSLTMQSFRRIKIKLIANFLFIFFLFLPSSSLFSRQNTYQNFQPPVPWFTGTLLPPSAINAQPGHPVFAPYISLTLTYGNYNDNWKLNKINNTFSINPFIEFLFGINESIGVDVYASFISNFKEGQKSTHLQDTIVLIGFQIAKDTPKSWTPDIRITLQETFPTGNYQKLNPQKLGIDATGQGSFQTGFNLITQKLFPLENHYLILKWTIGYLFPSSVHVKGLNTYGGEAKTSGKIFPGQTLMAYFSGEYSLTQRWALAFDTFFEYQGNASFSGRTGRNLDGTPSRVGSSPKIQMSIAPEVEYNLSATSGILLGGWATIFGKNSPAFASIFVGYYITW